MSIKKSLLDGGISQTVTSLDRLKDPESQKTNRS